MFGLFRKKQNIMEKYAEYKYFSDMEENAEIRWISLKVEGWKALTHEILDSRITQDFGLHSIKERCWAGNYVDGRRKVISIFLVNDQFATIRWGWNFDYIPRISGKKCVWVRTDKSIYLHTFRLSESFVNGREDHSAYEKAVFGSLFYYRQKEFDKAIVEDLETAYEYVKKDIRAYFEKTDTYAGMLSEMKDICQDHYYGFLHPYNYPVYLAIENYAGDKEKAKEDFEKMEYFDSEELKAEFGKKIGLN